MQIAAFKDLCLDVADPERVGAFWAGVLGLTLTVEDDGDGVLRGATPHHTLWLNVVPEPKTSKNRVHLDLRHDDLGSLLALGATVRAADDSSQGWTVLADPEGHDFCVFPVAGDAPTALVVDSSDPVALARWWADLLGAQTVSAPNGEPRWLANVPGLPFDRWKFVHAEDRKTGKNRMHWDIDCDDVPSLVARGATILRIPDNEVRWHVLADPQGNEFCVFATS